MIDHELTDPAGGALTITHDHQGVWITATEDRDEVTVGPFPVTSLTDAVTVESDAEVSGDLMDGGVTAAAIEAEVVSPERARSLVQDLAETRKWLRETEDRSDEWMTRAKKAEQELEQSRRGYGALLGKLDAAEKERDRLAITLTTTARQRDEADKRATTASPHPLTADDIYDNPEITNRAIRKGMEWGLFTSRDLEDSGAWNRVEELLAAALTEPQRPEGAEEIEALLREAWDRTIPFESPTESAWGLADWLAERGVRVTGAES